MNFETKGQSDRRKRRNEVLKIFKLDMQVLNEGSKYRGMTGSFPEHVIRGFHMVRGAREYVKLENRLRCP
jgi:hypothetical protein